MKRIYLSFVILVAVFFWKFFILGLIPFPGDIVIGSYFPWLNSKWGFTTGVAVKNPPMSDITSQMYPWRYLVIQDLKQGHLPLWDPTSFAGQTLIGNIQAGIFNPFNILLFIGSFNFGWGLEVIIQPLLAMVCMSILLKQYKLPKLSILFSSICYGFSAPLIMWSEYNVNGFTMAIFPLYFYFIETKEYIWISLLVTLGIFFGYPQLLYYSVGFSFLYLIFRSHYNWRQIIYFIGSVILGLIISAIQLVPAQEALKSSIRDVDVVALGNGLIYMPIKNLLMILIPDYFGNPATYNFWGGGSYESFCSYSSILAILLAVRGGFNKSRKELVLILLGFIVLVFGLVLSSPLSWLVQQLIFLGLHGSIGARSFFVYSFAISLLAAFGLEDLKSFKKLDLIIPGILFLIIGITGILYYQNKSSQLMIGLRNSLWPLVIIVLSLLVLLITKKYGHKFLIGLILILVIDVFHFGWKYLPFVKSNLIYPSTPSLEYLQKTPQPNRIAVERGEILPSNTWTVYGLQNLAGYNILVPHNTTDFLSVLNANAFGLENARAIDIKNFNSPLLNLANVRYIAVLKRKNGSPDSTGGIDPRFITEKYLPVFQEGPMVILENQAALPRYLSFGQYSVNSNSQNILLTLNKTDFDIYNKIILDQDPKLQNLRVCRINLNNYTGQNYQFQTNCPANSILMISESYNSGWKVKINNDLEKVYKADGNFIATVLPQGNSKVEFYYLPDSLIQGATLSLLGILIFLTLIWYQSHSSSAGL